MLRCNKWEQGEIPQAHARFLGLRPADVDLSFQSSRKTAGARARTQEEPSRGTAAAEMQSESLSAALSEEAARGMVDVDARKLEGVSLRGGEGVEGRAVEQVAGDRFITYWSQKGTDRPVKWIFFDDATFEVGASF